MPLNFPRLVIVPHTQVQHRKHLCRPLVGSGEGVPYPHVAVAEGIDDKTFRLARRGGRPADEALLREAKKVTSALTWSWSVAQESGFWFWKRPSLLRGMGDPMVPIAEMTTDNGGVDDLATELLLLPEAMAEASLKLRSSTVFAVVPKRGWLMVGPGEAGNPILASAMHEVAQGIASRAGRSVVSGDVVLIWQGGKIIGVDCRADGGGYISLQGEDEAAWWP